MFDVTNPQDQPGGDIPSFGQTAQPTPPVDPSQISKATDFASRGIPYFASQNGTIKQAADSSGGAVSNLNDSTGVVGDRWGNSQISLANGGSGPAKDSIKAGDVVSAPQPSNKSAVSDNSTAASSTPQSPALPVFGQTPQQPKPPTVPTSVAITPTATPNELIEKAAKQQGGPISQEHADWLTGTSQDQQMRNQLAMMVPGLDQGAQDRASVQRAINSHFDGQMADLDAQNGGIGNSDPAEWAKVEGRRQQALGLAARYFQNKTDTSTLFSRLTGEPTPATVVPANDESAAPVPGPLATGAAPSQPQQPTADSQASPQGPDDSALRQGDRTSALAAPQQPTALSQPYGEPKTPTGAAQEAEPASQQQIGQALADAQQGKKFYSVDQKGNLTFGQPGQTEAAMDQAQQDGLVSSQWVEQNRQQAQKVDQAYQDLQKAAGNNQQLKAMLTGAAKGTAFGVGTAPGTVIGSNIGRWLGGMGGVLVPGAGETGASELGGAALGTWLGGLIGGIISGSIASHTAEATINKLAQYNQTVRSFAASSQLHPNYDAAGNLVSFAAPNLLSKGLGLAIGKVSDGTLAQNIAHSYMASSDGLASTVRNFAQDAQIRAAGGATTGQIAQAIGTKVLTGVAANVAIDAVLNQGLHAMGLQPQGETPSSAIQAALLGAFAAGHGITFRDYDSNEVGQIALRGMLREKAGLGLDQDMTSQQAASVSTDANHTQIIQQGLSKAEQEVYQAFKGELLRKVNTGQIPNVDPGQITATARQAMVGGQPYGVTSANVESSARPTEPTPNNPAPTPTITGPPIPAAPTAPEQHYEAKTLGDAYTLGTPISYHGYTGTVGKDDQGRYFMTHDGTHQVMLPGSEDTNLTDIGGQVINPAAGQSQRGNQPQEEVTQNYVRSDERKGEQGPGGEPRTGQQAEGDGHAPGNPPGTQVEPVGREPGESPGANASPGSRDRAGTGGGGNAQDALGERGGIGGQLQQEHGPDGRTTASRGDRGRAGDLSSAEGAEAEPSASSRKVSDAIAAKDKVSYEGMEGFLHQEQDGTLTFRPQQSQDRYELAPSVRDQAISDIEGLGLIKPGKRGRKASNERQVSSTPSPQTDEEKSPANPERNDTGELSGAGEIVQPSSGPGAEPAAEGDHGAAGTINDVKAHEAVTSPHGTEPAPTEPQKQAGNYRLGHLKVGGLDISIENPEGSTRSGTTAHGKPWSTTMQQAHYGYLKGTVGRDKDHLDVFVKQGTPENWDGQVFVVNQRNPDTGRFDEHKAVVGAGDEAEARQIYQANYQAGWKGLESVQPMTLDQFKAWSRNPVFTKRKATPGAVEAAQATKQAPPAPQAQESAKYENVLSAAEKLHELGTKVAAERLARKVQQDLAQDKGLPDDQRQALEARVQNILGNELKKQEIKPNERPATQAQPQAKAEKPAATAEGMGAVQQESAEHAEVIPGLGKFRPAGFYDQHPVARQLQPIFRSVEPDLAKLGIKIRPFELSPEGQEKCGGLAVWTKPGTIIWDPNRIAKAMETIKGLGGDPDEWLRQAVDEEVTHILTVAATGGKHVLAVGQKIWDQMTDAQKEACNQLYTNTVENSHKGLEWLRMVDQTRRQGTITEASGSPRKAEQFSKARKLLTGRQGSVAEAMLAKIEEVTQSTQQHKGVTLGSSVEQTNKGPEARKRIIEELSKLEDSAIAKNRVQWEHLAGDEDVGELWNAHSGASGNQRWGTVYQDGSKWVASDEDDHTLGRFDSIDEAKEELADHIQGGDTQEAYNFRQDARSQILESLKLPEGMELQDVQDTKWGSVYFKVQQILSRDEDGEPDKTEDYKIRIGDHPASPFREQEFGASNYYASVPKNAHPSDIAAAVDRIEKWLNERESGETVLSNPPEENPQPFYSQLARVLAQKMPSSATPTQIRAIVDPARGSGVKPEELKWSSLDQFLEGKDKVSKRDVLDYLRNEGAVKFEEQKLGIPQRNNETKKELVELINQGIQSWDEDDLDEEEYPGHQDAANEAADLGSEALEALDKNDWETAFEKIRSADSLEMEYGDDPAWGEANRYVDSLEGKASFPDNTKYSEYQLPGGTNYREVVLSMPKKEDQGPQLKDFPNQKDYFKAREEWIKANPSQPEQYTSSHFSDVENYVAHMRLNDREDREGNPGTLIEEIQSDRHQEGREKGYIGDETLIPNGMKISKNTFLDSHFYTVEIIGPPYNWRGPLISTKSYEEAVHAANKYELHEDLGKLSGVSDAPFRKDWPVQMFKRALRDAVAAGKKWIGWTNGITQIERYPEALRQVVDHIEWKTNEDGEKEVVANKNGKEVFDAVLDKDGHVVESKVSDAQSKHIGEIIGKTMGERVLNEESGSIEGKDFTVGGEGMKGFYDTILPSEIGKYVKKWGGKVEKGELPVGASEGEKGPTQIWKVQITPEMARQVELGQALFSGAPESSEDAVKIPKSIHSLLAEAQKSLDQNQNPRAEQLGRKAVERIEKLTGKGSGKVKAAASARAYEIVNEAVTRQKAFMAKRAGQTGTTESRAAAAIKNIGPGPKTTRSANRVLNEVVKTARAGAQNRLDAAFQSVKAIGQQIGRWTTEAPEASDYLRILGRYLGAGSEADQKQFGIISGIQYSAQQIRNLIHTIKAQFSRETLEAIPHWIEAEGDEDLLRQRAAASKPENRARYEKAANLTEKEKDLARQIQKIYSDMLELGQHLGILRQAFQNYVTHLLDDSHMSEDQKAQALAALMSRYDEHEGDMNTLKKNFGPSLRRIIGTYFEAEQLGFRAKTYNAADILGYYLQGFNETGIWRLFIKALNEEGRDKTDGRELAIPGGYSKPSSLNFTPSLLMKAGEFDLKKYGDFVQIDHPSMRSWPVIAQDVDGSPKLIETNILVHPSIAPHLKNVLGRSKFSDIPALSIIRDIQGIAKATLLSFSAFHFVTEGTHGSFHGINPFKIYPIDFNDPLTRELVNSGLMLVHWRAQQEFGEGLTGGGVFSTVPGVGQWLGRLSSLLFEQVIPGYKLAMAKASLERNLKAWAKDIEAGKLTREQVLMRVAKDANDSFGEQNYRFMGRNPTLQDTMRLALLAPDFLESRMKFGASAFQKYGTEQRRALLFAIAGVYAVSKIIENILNKGDQSKVRYDRPFSVTYGGREYYLRTVPGDMWELATKPRQFFMGRLSPLIGRTGLEAATGMNWRGQKRDFVEQVEDMLSGIMPISAQGLVPGNARGLSPLESLASATGLGVRRSSNYTDMRTLGRQWQVKQGKANADAVFPPSHYTPLRDALEDGRTEDATKELEKLAKDGGLLKAVKGMRESLIKPFSGKEENENEFYNTLSHPEQQRYQQARQDQKLMLARLYAIGQTLHGQEGIPR